MTRQASTNATAACAGSHIAQAAEALTAGELDQAESACRTALRGDPKSAVALQLLGLVMHRRDDFRAAVEPLEHSIEIDGSQPAWHFNLGVSRRAAGDLQGAKHAYLKAIGLDPAYTAAHHNLGSVLLALGDRDGALKSFQSAIKHDPSHANALYQLGSLYRSLGDIGSAVAALKRAVRLLPDDDEARLHLHVALTEAGDLDGARTGLDKLCRDRPGWIEPAVALSVIHERLGDMDRAWELLEPATKTNPVPVDAALVLADLAPKLDRMSQAIGLLQEVVRLDSTDDDQRMLCHFALGRLRDRQDDCERAFDHFSQANRLKRKRFDPGAHERLIDAMIETFSRGSVKDMPRGRSCDDRPIFIVGMPRSGTSLVEQILASHPQVTGGGELPQITSLAGQVQGATGSSEKYPRCVKSLTQTHLDQMAKVYSAKLDTISKDAHRITDKTPTNFLHLGLIAQALPNARVIHCRRDPLATCWSCYTHHFVGRHDYSYDLTHLGLYHRQYQRLMRHWQEVLSLPVLDLHYEQLIGDPEPVMRSLIDFCGLEWDDACLRFHENTRPMPSASYDQVRRPIYTTSIDRWRRYETHLAPLRGALGG